MRERDSWDVVWMSVAWAVSKRSDCQRAQYGAVIVTPGQRIVATGFNGLPRGSPDSCGNCPRFLKGPEGAGREECHSVHSEANALLFADRREVEHGTLYSSGATCWGCARLIANSGLDAVVMTRDGGAHRDQDGVIDYLTKHGIAVSLWPA